VSGRGLENEIAQVEKREEPRLLVVPGEAEMSALAADIVTATLASDPECAISLPTGSTPLGMYHELIARGRAGAIDLTRFQFFCLDEYLGVSPDDPNTLTHWLMQNFIIPAGIPLENVHMLPVLEHDPQAAARAYEEAIAAAGGLELAILGISENGHIAYNEPGSGVDSRTRVVDLTTESIEQAAGYFGGAQVPAKAMTVGVGTLLEARQIVLIAAGESKQEILLEALRGPIGADVPASWLRLAPEKVTVILDEDAARLLR
jgi:glucosamine-6-phosphate deaminase